MGRNKKSQIAMEYMLIVGFAFVTSILMFVLFYGESAQISYQITSKQIDQVATQVASSADKVYYLGENSKTTLKLNIPSNIANATVGNNEIVFYVMGPRGAISHNVKVTVGNVTGRLPYDSGFYSVTIQSLGDRVLINYTSRRRWRLSI